MSFRWKKTKFSEENVVIKVLQSIPRILLTDLHKLRDLNLRLFAHFCLQIVISNLISSLIWTNLIISPGHQNSHLVLIMCWSCDKLMLFLRSNESKNLIWISLIFQNWEYLNEKDSTQHAPKHCWDKKRITFYRHGLIHKVQKSFEKTDK
jgi:hypothetical protein